MKQSDLGKSLDPNAHRVSCFRSTHTYSYTPPPKQKKNLFTPALQLTSAGWYTHRVGIWLFGGSFLNTVRGYSYYCTFSNVFFAKFDGDTEFCLWLRLIIGCRKPFSNMTFRHCLSLYNSDVRETQSLYNMKNIIERWSENNSLR
jgi:hypothetical protein